MIFTFRIYLQSANFIAIKIVKWICEVMKVSSRIAELSERVEFAIIMLRELRNGLLRSRNFFFVDTKSKEFIELNKEGHGCRY